MLVLLVCSTWDGRLASKTESVSIRLGLLLAGMFLATVNIFIFELL